MARFLTADWIIVNRLLHETHKAAGITHTMSAIRRRSSPQQEVMDNLKKGIRPILGKINGAGNGGRTRDHKLGKLVLYQLSYARPWIFHRMVANRPS